MSRLDEARCKRGKVFDAIRDALDGDNAAWYEVENKPALASEVIQTRRALIKQLQRSVDSWEKTGGPH